MVVIEAKKTTNLANKKPRRERTNVQTDVNTNEKNGFLRTDFLSAKSSLSFSETLGAGLAGAPGCTAFTPSTAHLVFFYCWGRCRWMRCRPAKGPKSHLASLICVRLLPIVLKVCLRVVSPTRIVSSVCLCVTFLVSVVLFVFIFVLR